MLTHDLISVVLSVMFGFAATRETLSIVVTVFPDIRILDVLTQRFLEIEQDAAKLRSSDGERLQIGLPLPDVSPAITGCGQFRSEV